MKAKVFLPVAIMLFIATFFVSNVYADTSDDVVNAIKSGNSKALSQYFANSIDMVVPGKEGTFSQSQAEIVLKNFFMKNPPESFQINHKGSSDSGSLYMIGSYKSKGKTYRTYILLVKSSGKFMIEEIQFEEE